MRSPSFHQKTWCFHAVDATYLRRQSGHMMRLSAVMSLSRCVVVVAVVVVECCVLMLEGRREFEKIQSQIQHPRARAIPSLQQVTPLKLVSSRRLTEHQRAHISSFICHQDYYISISTLNMHSISYRLTAGCKSPQYFIRRPPRKDRPNTSGDIPHMIHFHRKTETSSERTDRAG